MRQTLQPPTFGLSIATALGLLALTTTPLNSQQTHAGEYAQADITYGMQVYGETCVGCHGPDGDAIVGVNFRTGQFRNASSDPDLMEIIRDGIPDTAMPPGNYDRSELTALVAYLRTMGDIDSSNVDIGDAVRGETM